MVLPTGERFALRLDGPDGPVEASVTELAAGLRSLRVDGVDLVQDYAASSLPSWGSGMVLVPWPNRVRDATWTLDGATQQLDITEPSRHNAIHGLLRNTGYRVVAQTADAVELAATVFPQHGYPFHLATSVRYALRPDCLVVTHTVENVGDGVAPFGVGAHPFLRVGDSPARELTVTVAAERVIRVDERLLPVATVPVEGTPDDLRGGVPLADARFDTAYTGLTVRDGLVAHRLSAPDGRAVELWADPVFAWVQVFLTDAYAAPSGTISAVAIEPMTCPPDALNSGEGLQHVGPGERWSASWGIRRSSEQ